MDRGVVFVVRVHWQFGAAVQERDVAAWRFFADGQRGPTRREQERR